MKDRFYSILCFQANKKHGIAMSMMGMMGLIDSIGLISH